MALLAWVDCPVMPWELYVRYEKELLHYQGPTADLSRIRPDMAHGVDYGLYGQGLMVIIFYIPRRDVGWW